MKQDKPIKLRMDAGTYYVWVGGSCDYAHKERAGGGAYIMEKGDKVIDTYVTADTGTTEFRMMLAVMLHAMSVVPEGSSIIFLTIVSYIQNFDKEPTDSSANADLIRECIAAKRRHNLAVVRIVPYHKYHQLPDMLPAVVAVDASPSGTISQQERNSRKKNRTTPSAY